MKVSQLKKNPSNPRQIKDAKFELLKKSIEDFPAMMELRPMVVDETNTLLGGNMRLAAIKALGMKEIPDEWVKRADELTDEQKKEFVIKDNNSFGEYDWDLLNQGDWTDFDLASWGLDIPNFEAVEPEPIEEDEAAVGEMIDKAEELNKKWEVKSGQLWQIGRHRLLCGDSTKKEDVERLMDGEKANGMWTDPPYNVDYEGGTSDALKIENDSMSDAAFLQFLCDAMRCADEVLKEGAAYYIAHPDVFAFEFITAVRACQWKQARPPVVLWVKDSLVLGRGDYHSQSEPLLYGWKKGAAHHSVQDRSQSNVWNISRPRRSEEHPTMKPVELVARAIRNSSDIGELWYEPFAGSGTTLLACEQEKRICYGIELSPAYCSVILERLTALGLEAKRID